SRLPSWDSTSRRSRAAWWSPLLTACTTSLRNRTSRPTSSARRPANVLVDLLADGATELDEDRRATVQLDGYGFRWLRVSTPDERRLD
ncbi:MAG: hypothetical protein JJE50_16380, partial [Actinomycetales bacterium]|nr:hypothetical protein [Actinomycetales bacterium]